MTGSGHSSPTPDDVAAAKATLTAAGFTVLRTGSYRAAQERQRIAQVRMDDAFDRVRSVEAWARSLADEARHLRDRCTYLYGLAARHGATDDELAGPLEVENVTPEDLLEGAVRVWYREHPVDSSTGNPLLPVIESVWRKVVGS